MKAFTLEPYIASAVWGGRKLIDEWGFSTDKKNAAEAWVLSALAGQSSRLENGGNFRDYLGEADAENFPILIKLIDARDDLSVQVHPTAAYCAVNEGCASKTECWLILDCDENAQLAMGFNRDVTCDEVRQALADGSIMEIINFVPVKKGDFFFIPSGTLHAIGKGIFLAEVQQSSNTTFRLYDYKRLGLDGKERELHIEEALACLDFRANTLDSSGGVGVLCDCEFFRAERLTAPAVIQSGESFCALLILEGAGNLEQADEFLDLHKGSCVFVPGNSGEYRLCGEMDVLRVEGR
ncbi:MAG: class I mannose-6-phosphate isomerase [Oscillospiraceae bacterium]|nr:class I mannose-6-phosphate isomerase [Oscillospiraceae bacterium]